MKSILAEKKHSFSALTQARNAVASHLALMQQPCLPQEGGQRGHSADDEAESPQQRPPGSAPSELKSAILRIWLFVP